MMIIVSDFVKLYGYDITSEVIFYLRAINEIFYQVLPSGALHCMSWLFYTDIMKY